ncbi:hypothetical protein DdX_10978 [Ditylenchus destructor]|uniref:Uncharacterized protein n=1 Tax=Ditylenchus destructor TaxID=166010 RepID=A0AAD4MXP9_9BILA|nr:hypothetical protein DdX_10978 [Ditylenchus destructor]
MADVPTWLLQAFYTPINMFCGLAFLGMYKSAAVIAKQYAHVTMTGLCTIQSLIMLILPLIVSLIVPDNSLEQELLTKGELNELALVADKKKSNWDHDWGANYELQIHNYDNSERDHYFEEEFHVEVFEIGDDVPIPPFRGEGNISFTEWLIRFQDLADAQNTPWADELKLNKLKFMLEGSAREKFEQLTVAEKGNYGLAVNKLTSLFENTISRNIARQGLRNCKRIKGEPVRAFMTRLKRLVTAATVGQGDQMFQQVLLDEFMDRLEPTLGFHVKISQPATVEEAYNKALHIEHLIEAQIVAKQKEIEEIAGMDSFSTWCPRGLDLHFKPSPLRLGYNTGVNQIQLPRSLQRPSAFTFGYASGLVQRRITRHFGFSPTHRRIGFTKGNSRVLRRQRPSIEVERASGLKEDLSKGTAQHLIGLSGSSRSSYNSEAAQLSDEDSIHRSKRTLSNLSAEASQLEQKRLNRRYSIGSLSIRRSTRPPIATLKHRLTPRGLNCFNRPASTLSGFNRNAAFPLAQLRKHRAFRSSGLQSERS